MVSEKVPNRETRTLLSRGKFKKSTKGYPSGTRTLLSNNLFNSTKGQLKIQQMAFMLMAITLFFVLAGMFLFVFLTAGLKQSSEDICQKNALLLVTKLANSPEFSCGDSFGSRKATCIDADKVMILKENIEKYRGFWGVESIQIRKILSESSEECDISNYPDCGTITIKESEEGYVEENFVILCSKRIQDGQKYDKCEIAKLLVGSKEKQC